MAVSLDEKASRRGPEGREAFVVLDRISRGSSVDSMMLRLRLVSLLPFLSRWIEVAPAACCGVCPTCIGTAVTGLA